MMLINLKDNRLSFLLFLLFIFLFFSNGFATENHEIEYIIKNSAESAKDLEGILKVEMPKYLDLIGNKEINLSPIPIGNKDAQSIQFEISDYKSVGRKNVVELNIERTDSQSVIMPDENKIVLEDNRAPQKDSSYLNPTTVYVDDLDKIDIVALFEDDFSGIKDGQVVNIEGNSTTINTTENKTAVIEDSIKPNMTPGRYRVYIAGVQDNAGNYSGRIYLGSYRVEKREERPPPPDESLDNYSAVINEAEVEYYGKTVVGVLNLGYAQEMKGLLSTFGEKSDSVKINKVSANLVNRYPILIIPSGGLANQTNVKSLKDRFSEYVKQGGTLLLMAQTRGKCYDLLPDKVGGLGYYQDKACYNVTGQMKNYNYALAGQKDTRVDGTADGVITSWPQNAEVWIKRIKNKFPALLNYKHGSGRVIVSTYYSDFAYGHSQLHQDEKRLIRDLLSWSRDFADLPEVKVGDSKEVKIPLNSKSAIQNKELQADEVKLILRSPNRKKVKTKKLAISNKEGVTFDFDDTNRQLSKENKSGLGIWWINYEFYKDGRLIQKEIEGQRIVLHKELEVKREEELQITVNPKKLSALEGDKIPFNIIVNNNQGTARSLKYKIYNRRNNKKVTSGSINLEANDKVKKNVELNSYQSFTRIRYMVNKNWWRFVFVDEEGQEIVTEERGVSVYKPTVDAKYSFSNLTRPEDDAYQPGDEVKLDLSLLNNIPLDYPIKWSFKLIAPDNSIVYSNSGEDNLSTLLYKEIKFNLPEHYVIGDYEVQLKVSKGNQKLPMRLKSSDRIRFVTKALSINKISKSSANISNLSKSNIKYDLSYKILDRDEEVFKENKKGSVLSKENKSISFSPPTNLSPFKRYKVKFNLAYKGRTEEKKLKINPLDQIDFEKPEQKIIKTNHKLNYNLRISNQSISTMSDLDLKVNIGGSINQTKSFALSEIKVGEKMNKELELKLPKKIYSGTYPVRFFICNDQGQQEEVANSTLKAIKTRLKVKPLKTELSPGDNWGVAIKNVGDRTTKVSYQITLSDNKGYRINKTASTTIPAGEEMAPKWLLDSKFKAGNYMIEWDIETSPIVNKFKNYKRVNLEGTEASIEVKTEKDFYSNKEKIAFESYISNQNYPTDGVVNFDLTKFSTYQGANRKRIDDWTTVGGNNQRTDVAKLPANIKEPSILWKTGFITTGFNLVGNVDEDKINEALFFNVMTDREDYAVAICDGKTGTVEKL